ncbi:uncharacterized protein LOC128238376 isoform X2 [Mya arenaria]|uniref:uncharacterized protein LOC128238376 isoform X2 n=1 Tax=Mya arenaria TaxID=6604 RepID=UPI0022E48B4E|nr:uncharacterized protein LOC128238376 isoform X2 [Mya arenaria]
MHMEEDQTMDENTRMMIHMASMLMQNQSAIKETQSQLHEKPADVTGKKPATDQIADDSLKTPLSGASGHTAFGMDPKLMAEFARQIVMNAGHKKTPDKPTTIAQIIQSQKAQMSTPLTNVSNNNNSANIDNNNIYNSTSEGKIFVYNQLPEVGEGGLSSVSTAADIKPDMATLASLTNGHMQTTPTSRRQPTIGPIRNKYGRVLRPGIDNFGRFEAVANHGLIMHAMELLRQKDKKKRGPKEKDTFAVFMYCLPDKNSKLPKFSSLDPIERALVDQHQQEGYGYPSLDYINGIPRKTQLCLSFDEAAYRAYMVTLYPRLGGRRYDMYRIDKTRRLIRVEARSPRQLKDMKYQGSLIIIPYDEADDRPAPVIHRNFDDVYSGNGVGTCSSLGNPLNLIQNFNIPLPSLPEGTEVINHKPEVRRPTIASQTMTSSLKSDVSLQTKASMNGDGSHSDMDVDKTTAATSPGQLIESTKLLKRAFESRSSLKSVKKIQVKAESIFTDLLNAYREDETLETHRLVVCIQDECGLPVSDTSNSSVLVAFWDEAFKKHFTGNHHLVPTLDPSAGEDLFQIFGRVLVHGLIQESYLPLCFSPACLSFILANTCSDQLSLSSFYQAMSKTEREVLLAALAEAKLGLENFSPRIDRSIKTVLGSYGCKQLPQTYDLDSSIPNIAKSFLLHRPYWALCQIQEVFCQSEIDISGITEDDIIQVYKVLSPDVPSLLLRLKYIFSEADDERESEEKVKDIFEEYLHKLSETEVQKLLQHWCGYDCLCVELLSVRFQGEEPRKSMFDAKLSTMYLPSSVTSGQELSQFLDAQMSSVYTSESGSNWEYTL